MMTVRFPNGQAVQYNEARYVARYDSYTDLYDKKDGVWIAQVPNTCLIESQPACRVYDALQQQPLEQFTKEVRALKRKIARKS